VQIGDRVKLRPDLARQRTVLCDGRVKERDWTKRVGTVAHLGKRGIVGANDRVGVRWEGKKWKDYWPEKALVLADEGGK